MRNKQGVEILPGTVPEEWGDDVVFTLVAAGFEDAAEAVRVGEAAHEHFGVFTSVWAAPAEASAKEKEEKAVLLGEWIGPVPDTSFAVGQPTVDGPEEDSYLGIGDVTREESS